MRYTDPALLDALAREYVLGTLRGRARQRFERILREQPSARTAVFAWERRLQDLDGAPPAEAPPARVWPMIESRIAFAGASARRRVSFVQRTVQALAAGIAAVALVGGGYLLNQYVATEQAPVASAYVSVVTNADGEDIWLVRIADDSGEIEVSVTGDVAPLDNRVYQLWMLPDGGNPVSLGLLPDSGSSTGTVSSEALSALARSANLAVSTEPPGGSPTGQPTGDVVYVAALVRG